MRKGQGLEVRLSAGFIRQPQTAALWQPHWSQNEGGRLGRLASPSPRVSAESKLQKQAPCSEAEALAKFQIGVPLTHVLSTLITSLFWTKISGRIAITGATREWQGAWQSQGLGGQFSEVQAKLFPSRVWESFLSDNLAHPSPVSSPLWWVKSLWIAVSAFSLWMYSESSLYAAIQSRSPGLRLISTFLYEDEPLTHLKCFLFYVFNQRLFLYSLRSLI